jgi:hypothetical protein
MRIIHPLHNSAHPQNQRTQRRSVAWGCAIHRMPAGQECPGCADQAELITWDDIRQSWRGAISRPGVRRHD